ncbi:FolC bifunctional family protein [uncultured delta proteobacterium]|uniref:tetrahydrofolate synthase n=1 Tax=uncultured delta proteobacterium TaxID=34034 RepID=A0A212JFX9_9DELT|nr:FolC bifunctional family protein [uncultured delta proteobacterium]
MRSHTHFASFAELAAHLDKLGMFRMRPELGKLREVLGRLALPKPLAVAQVAGTNGKGSTATFLAALAQAHGLRTGLFTSPHFVSFRERIRINGVPVSEAAILAPANAVMAAGGETLTYFEFVTALAAYIFSAGISASVADPLAPAESLAPVDVAVMETGLGGAWDAVTALPADALAYTPIGLDHCRVLGDTVTAIATDKAGAIRGGKPVFSAAQPAEALAALKSIAAERGSPFFLAGERESLPDPIRDGAIPLGLAGEHQYTNAGLALAVWRHLARENGWDVSEEKESRALATAFIPGRLQYVPASEAHGHPALLLDGAHNGHGMAALGKNLAAKGVAPAAVIFACLEDKNPAEMAAHLRVLATGPVFVPPIQGNPRALEPEQLARAIGLAAVPATSMADALARAREHVAAYMPVEAAAHPERHPVLICGSLYMLGDFFALRPDCLEPPTQKDCKP